MTEYVFNGVGYKSEEEAKRRQLLVENQEKLFRLCGVNKLERDLLGLDRAIYSVAGRLSEQGVKI